MNPIRKFITHQTTRNIDLVRSWRLEKKNRGYWIHWHPGQGDLIADCMASLFQGSQRVWNWQNLLAGRKYEFPLIIIYPSSHHHFPTIGYWVQFFLHDWCTPLQNLPLVNHHFPTGKGLSQSYPITYSYNFLFFRPTYYHVNYYRICTENIRKSSGIQVFRYSTIFMYFHHDFITYSMISMVPPNR